MKLLPLSLVSFVAASALVGCGGNDGTKSASSSVASATPGSSSPEHEAARASSAPAAETSDPAPLPATKVGDAAPAFRLPGSDGKTHSLADHAGKQVVIVAWFPKAFTGG